MLKILAAAQKVDRENLDNTVVHVCDRADDTVRRQQLFGAALELSRALAEANLTLPNPC